MNQQQWQNKGWIDSQAPRGWFQWYCDLYVGRPTINDKLQCGRWIRFDRWLVQYQKNPSPVIAQSLLHWAYKI